MTNNEQGPSNLVWVQILATEPLSNQSYSSNDIDTWENRSHTLNQFGVRTGVYTYLFPVMLGEENARFYSVNAKGVIVRINALSLEDIIVSSTAVLSKRVLHYCPIKYLISTHNDGYLIEFESGYKKNMTNTDNVSVRLVRGGNTNFGGLDIADMGGLYINLYKITSSNINDTLSKTYNVDTISTSSLNINNLRNIDFEPKLKNSPFYFINLTDNQSVPFKLSRENISGEHKLKFVQSLGVQSKSKIYLTNYLGDNGKFHNSINNTVSELPLFNDAYLSYMASNKASATSGVALNILTGATSLALGLATGGIGLIAGAGASMSMGQRVANEIIKKRDLQDTPNTLRSQGNNAEFDVIDNNFKYEEQIFSINEHYKQKVFDFFTHMGYAVNAFKTPNFKSRYYYNYIETLDCNIVGNLDNHIITRLKQIFDNGVTIWHYRDNATFKGLYNYDYENVEMSLLSN